MEPPIQDLESIDLVGEREDDGIDLGIVCSGPLDESPDTLARLKEKLSGYIAAAASPSLWDEFPTAAPGPVRILICCNYPISVAAQELIDVVSLEARTMGVEVLIEREPA